MRTKSIIFIIISIAFLVANLPAKAGNDTLTNKKTKNGNPLLLTPYHKNVIKFNPTPMLMWGEIRNVTFSYERLIKKNQSIAVQLGFLSLPRIFNDTIAMVVFTSEKRNGLNSAVDYRYYPFQRNRRPAPDGLYLGGYLSYYGFRFTNQFTIPAFTGNQIGTTDGRVNFINLGVELGYQFIFWKRFSVDMLLCGPSLTVLSRSLKFTGQLTKDQIDDLDQEMVAKLLERFPSLSFLLGEESLKFTGNQTEFQSFFRYSIQLGFHF